MEMNLQGFNAAEAIVTRVPVGRTSAMSARCSAESLSQGRGSQRRTFLTAGHQNLVVKKRCLFGILTKFQVGQSANINKRPAG